MRTTLSTPLSTRTLPVIATIAAISLLAACGSSTTSEGGATSSEAAGASGTSSASAPASVLTVTDGWVKATTDEKMSAAFGTLHNDDDRAVVITGGSTPVAGMVEAHVMTKGEDGQMVMEEAEDGFTVDPGGSMELAPGGEHLMLMKLRGPLKAGDEVVVTATDDGGKEYPLTFSVREFAGADEDYEPSATHSNH